MAGEIAHVARALRARAADIEKEAEATRNALEVEQLRRISVQFRKLAEELEKP